MRHDYRMSEIDVAGGGAPVLRGTSFTTSQ